MKNIYKYKEILTFCLMSAISFVLMDEAVKTISPITSTFITYTITAMVFISINVKKIKLIISKSINHLYLIFQLNITTLVNTLAAFVVMLYISPLIYAIIFFGTIPFFTDIVKKNNINFKNNGILFIASILLSFYISNAQLLEACIGILLTLISSYFASIYLCKSEILHQKTGFTSSELLSIRFFVVIILCGLYAVIYDAVFLIENNEFALLSIIALTSSIIPLFLLQRAIKNLGAETTSLFLPLIPIFSVLILIFFDTSAFTAFEFLLIVLFAILFFFIGKLKIKVNKKKQ